jgi:hypothetical protein
VRQPGTHWRTERDPEGPSAARCATRPASAIQLEFASLVAHIVDIGSLNGEVIRLAGAHRKGLR